MRLAGNTTLVITLVALTLLATVASRSPAASAAGNTGSARFVQIDNIEGFSGFFNLARGTVRIVALLSPTCPECVAGYREITRIMKATPTRRLRSYVVFMPVRPTDTRALALALVSEHQDRRASYFWDPNFAVGEAFKTLVASETRIEDICFVFDTNAGVREGPDTPSLWMRQHDHGDDPTFDAGLLEERVHELLAKLGEQQRRQATEVAE